jgi:ribosomal protein S18 acetylase RimI-like enzyme
MQISQASVEDAQEILDLQKTAYRSEAELYNNYDISPLKQTIGEIKDQIKTQVFLKAVLDGKIVGTVRAYEKDGTCYIGKLAVDPGMQNRGIGTKLMKKVESCFTPDRFELFTGIKSVKNLHLYQKLGYSILKKKEIERDGVEMVYMEKSWKSA